MLLSLAAAAAAAAASICSPADSDRRWIDAARAAWRSRLAAIPELRAPPAVEVILFDHRCRLSSADALDDQASVRWTGGTHGGKVRLADGSAIPVGVTSFAGEGKRGSTFVMALPSIWAAAKVKTAPLDLDRLTTAVLLHEASHVAQGRLMTRVGALVRRRGFGEDFNDDSIQLRFEQNAAFTASVREETRLLFAAAQAPDDAAARMLARQARDAIKARRSRWMRGADRPLAQAEDLFLSMEGAGQYVGYSWLIDPAGGGVTRAAAMARFGAGPRWWSQAQGLALVLAIERLGLRDWRGHLWGEPRLVGAELLDAALRPALTSSGSGRTRQGSR